MKRGDFRGRRAGMSNVLSTKNWNIMPSDCGGGQLMVALAIAIRVMSRRLARLRRRHECEVAALERTSMSGDGVATK